MAKVIEAFFLHFSAFNLLLLAIIWKPSIVGLLIIIPSLVVPPSMGNSVLVALSALAVEMENSKTVKI